MGDKQHTGPAPPAAFPGEGRIQLGQCWWDKGEQLPVPGKAVPDQGTPLELVDSHRTARKVLELELCWM